MDKPTQVFQLAFSQAHKNFPNGGTCLEFGVGSGRSYIWQVDQILELYPFSKLVGFDSWQGLPKEEDGVWIPENFSEGCECYSKTMIETLMGRAITDPRFTFVDGLFSDTLTTELQFNLNYPKDLIFVNVDVDIYKSTVEVLDFIKPLLRKGVIIYFDDMKDPTDARYSLTKWGEYLAWEKFLLANTNIKVRLVSITSTRTQRFFEVISI